MSERGWLNSKGASSEVLAELTTAVGALPASYLHLLSRGNGGEASLQKAPFTLCIDSAESALEYWSSGTYTAAQVFVFGGDEGGLLFAFDLRTPGEWPVVEFDPIDPEASMRTIAAGFEHLLAEVARHEV